MADRGPESPKAPHFTVKAFSDEDFSVLNATAEQRFWENLPKLPQFSHTRPIIIDLDYIGTTEQNADAGDWSKVDEKMREGLQLLCQKAEEKGGFAFTFRSGGDEFRVVLLDHFTPEQKEELLKSWQESANERKITFRAACLVGEAPGLSLKYFRNLPDFISRVRGAADRIWKAQEKIEERTTSRGSLLAKG